MTVLVTGAAGSLGARLCRTLCRRGTRVRALDLDSANWDVLRDLDVERARGDVADPDVLHRAMQGIDVVVNCAALLPDHLHLGRAAFLRTNVLGPELVMRAARANAVERVVCISTAQSLVARGDGLTDDESPYRAPYDHYAWSKIEAEKRISALSVELGQPAVILRPTFVYGRGMRFRWQQLAQLVRRRRMVVFRGGRVPLPLIHVDDLVSAVIRAIDAPLGAGPEKIIIASSEDTTVGDIVDFMSEFYAVPKCPRVPSWPFHALAALIHLCPEGLKTERMKMIKKDSVAMYSTGYRFDTRKASTLLGFESAVPFAAGMRDMLESFENAG